MQKTQNKIIVGVDFSQFSLNALADASYFAKNHEHEIIMVYVIEPQRTVIDFLEGNHPEDEIREAARTSLEKLEKQYEKEGIKISHVFKSGKPYDQILQASKELEAELIFMGSKGVETMGDAFLGSNAARVARGADVPVIIIKEQSEDFSLDRILVPVQMDFGVRELRSFLRGYRVDFGKEVDLLAVVEENEDEDYVNQVKSHLNKQQEAFAKIGFTKVHLHLVRHSNVSEAIVKFADNPKNNIDMVLMETHGRKGISNFLLGSITEEVISHAKSPVLSLRPERGNVVRYYYHANAPF